MVGEKVVSRLTTQMLNPGLRKTLEILDVEEGPQIRKVPCSLLYPPSVPRSIVHSNHTHGSYYFYDLLYTQLLMRTTR